MLVREAKEDPYLAASDELRLRISALAEGGVFYSAGALTERGGEFTVLEGRGRTTEEALDEALRLAEALRRAVPGEADLVWRHLPEMKRDGDGACGVRVRLAFQPRMIPVAPGVWVEQARYAERNC